MTKLTALFLIYLTTPAFTLEPIPFTINTKKYSHVLDDHFISLNVNPTDLLQGKVYGLTMNATMSILKGLAPAYVRIGSADTAKYTFKKNRYPTDLVKPDDEYTVTEAHWMAFNEVINEAGLDVIVCLNAGHRIEGTKKWDSRNSLELISFSDSQGYNLTWQLGYEIQSNDDLSGLQFGKDLNRLRTILNAFPRYQHAKLIGPDIRVIHKREDIDFWNDVLIEAGPTLDAVTWHPRWPQPSKMKVSDNSELGYEFPIDYLEWDKTQLNKILQKSIFKNPVWIGETKWESTGTFAEGLIWARRLVLAAKLGIEVVMKHPNLMDVTHPKPEYWIALLHKRLLGKSVLETRSTTNHTDLTVISHCTNPFYWTDKPEKLQDGAVTVYGVNMGGFEQKIQIKGPWSGKSQLLFQYVLTSGSDPDSVFSQMTYLNGEPLMMTDDGLLPDIVPKIRKLEKGLTMKLPPYSVGFWVIPDARVKICQIHPHTVATINIETLAPTSVKQPPKNLENIQNINQFLVEKLMNPESESEEVQQPKIEIASSESSEKDISKENILPRVARKIRQVKPLDELNQEIKTIMQETEEFLLKPDMVSSINSKISLPKAPPLMEQRIQTIAESISDAIKTTNQEQEFNKFLVDSGLNKDFGNLLMTDRSYNAPGVKDYQYYSPTEMKQRLKRSIMESEEQSEEQEEESTEDKSEMDDKFKKKIVLVEEEPEDKNKKQDLLIPHNPDLKGLEERYKSVMHIKIQNGKRKIDDMKRKMKKEETEHHKSSQPEMDDLQEEIIKKEIELLEKTEETVADILETQKKRQETFKDIIFDELGDAKGERIKALREMYKMHKKKENAIVKRQSQTPLPKPLRKTVEFMEKSFNLEPESVRKIKRSLEEKMGEILKNYDLKKSMEVKKRMAERREKEERRPALKKSSNDERVKEDTERRKDEHRDEERRSSRKDDVPVKERNVIRKVSSKTSSKPVRKMEQKETRLRKGEEKRKEDDNDSFEMFNRKKAEDEKKEQEERRLKQEKKASDSMRKSNRRSANHTEEKKKSEKKETKLTPEKEPRQVKSDSEPKKEIKVEIKPQKIEEVKAEKKEKEPEKEPEKTPLKNDKDRRENMLKQISSMVDHMNSMERNGEISKKVEEDDAISEEFDTDRHKRKIRRWPRGADLSELQPEVSDKPPVVDSKKVEIITTEAAVTPSAATPTTTTAAAPITTTTTAAAPVTSTTTTTASPVTSTTASSRSSRKRKRVRPNRRQKEKKLGKEEAEETKIKRHLIFERPLDFEKKLKPKTKKVIPKLFRHQNELPNADKVVETEILMPQSNSQPIEAPTELPQVSNPIDPVLQMDTKKETNEEFKKDLEEIAEEKVFLGQGLRTLKEESKKSGEGSSEKKEIGTDFSGETPSPTEGYIVVEPTEMLETSQTQTEKSLTKSNLIENKAMKATEKPEIINQKSEDKIEENIEEKEKETKETKTKSSEEISISDKVEAEKKEIKEPEIKSSEEIEEIVEVKESHEVEKDIKDEIAKPRDLETSVEETPSSEKSKKFKIFLVSDSKEGMMLPRPLAEEGLKLAPEPPESSSLRKRRATFLTHRPDEEEEEDEDYSSEERIQKFKQMVYKKSPAKRMMKNEVRPSAGMGIGANEFLKMAGSTMRVMFDDVIPEAYGQTKTKIQNMGIPEYIKEFGNIVQQMRNLDQIFLNIGEAAVKGYIRGNRAEKGPYIQVISRKKRDAMEVSDASTTEQSTTVEDIQLIREDLGKKETEVISAPSFDTPTEKRTDHREYATTSTSEKSIDIKRWNDRSDSQYGSEPRESIYEDAKKADTSSATRDTARDTTEKTQISPQILVKDQLFNLPNQLPQEAKPVQPELGKNEPTGLKEMTKPLSENLQEKISPWIKTTKDFIHQAITTLQRQRELSEILAKESINDLMNSEMAPKAIAKRDISSGEEPQLPVRYVTGHKKRETPQKFSDESLIRHLRGLQPGVYVVPTEEMTNIRSEQITNEAKQKSGMPNVVTLNIYYDKKNPNAKSETTQTGEPAITQDAVTYYQNKAWNAAAGQYDPNIQYTLPMGAQDPNNPMVAPVNPVYAAEPRIAQLPNSRLIQYPSAAYHIPPVSKLYPPVVPNPQSLYSPLYYHLPENRLAAPPGTKRQWREFKARHSGLPVGPAYNSGWNVQFEPIPGTIRSSLKTLPANSYNKNFKLWSDKKRSIGDFKINPTLSETALPIWKFFPTSSSEKKSEDPESKKEEESDSVEDVVEEKQKKVKVEKTTKSNSVETITEETKEPETEPEEEEIEEEEEKSRRRRSIRGVPDKLQRTKRSYPYEVEFKDHDILPEWFGTYQEIGNSLDYLPTHVRRSHIVSTPLSDETEDILSILDADDELSLIDMDNDYYYSNDNSIAHQRRYPRSTDQFDSNSIKSNMIYKMPVNSEHIKPKMLSMSGVKKLTDEDSSLELITKAIRPDKTTPQPSLKMLQDVQPKPSTPAPAPKTTTPQQQLSFSTSTTITKNGTEDKILSRNPNDDTFYYLFKYAYDSLVKVMKSMTELF